MTTRLHGRAAPADVLTLQIEASDPQVSAFVAANAGSGKTYVLAQRVIRLLLQGVDPAKILCLTFTKAAAANMANRVFGELAKWTALDDAALDGAIAKIDGGAPDAARRARARRLFAQTLETPGGLKVQTIHAFCARLLHQFPFEAQVAARFSVLDERSEEELIAALRMNALIGAAANPQAPLGQALATAVANAADQSFTEALGAAISERDALARWLTHAGGLEAALAQLAHALGIAPEMTTEALADGLVSRSLLAEDISNIIAILRSGSKTDAEQGTRLECAQRASGPEQVDLYASLFLTQKMQPRQKLITDALAREHPRLAGRFAAEQARVLPLLDQLKAAAARERTAALVTIAAAIIDAYRAEKARRGLLDYADLIDKTLALLDRDGAAAWVHYKLDLGIDHVLIDEAQDTSPKQWEIVRRLVAEFTAGASSRSVKRTIFAVGDEKQSIYSFQGAAPRAFGEMRRRFERAHRDAGLEFRARQFKLSFRSGANVLSAVDRVFRERSVALSVTEDEAGMPGHESLPDAAPGLVEIWDLIEPPQRTEIEPWDNPFDTVDETSPIVTLARKIARTIKLWLARGERRGDGERLRPGDILVLVRQRGALFDAIIRALKDAEIDVAGADRLVLTEHIAVMDLMALGDALLSPQDDLALATALKSPLFGFDDDRLLSFAWGRSGTLREALRASADPELAAASSRLDHLATRARQESPFNFYSRLLGAERGRARILRRLGPEAADALDEFLALALDYERRAAPTLQGFIAWLRAVKAEIKRDMDVARNEVRVMTVHGAKGLEAPIVFIPDTTTRPAGPRPPLLLMLPAAGAPPGAPDRIVWPARKEADVEVMARARTAALGAAEDEYRRLLYVAMTRAAERLIICGARGRNSKPKGCWYDLVRDALAPEAISEPADDGDGTALRWRKAQPAAPVARPESAPADIDRQDASPPWLLRDAPASPNVHVAPTAQTPRAATAPRNTSSHGGLLRGRLAHRLMQSLPDIEPKERADVGRRYLARAAAALSPAAQEALLGEVLAVLDDPQFAPLFAPSSRAEVPIVGRLVRDGGLISVSGQVDRLAVNESEVLIADYKTDRPAPSTLADTPSAYLRQLSLYAMILRSIYPSRPVRAGLIWTSKPALMPIPSSALEETLVSGPLASP